eukprot:g34114.t1
MQRSATKWSQLEVYQVESLSGGKARSCPGIPREMKTKMNDMKQKPYCTSRHKRSNIRHLRQSWLLDFLLVERNRKHDTRYLLHHQK